MSCGSNRMFCRSDVDCGRTVSNKEAQNRNVQGPRNPKQAFKSGHCPGVQPVLKDAARTVNIFSQGDDIPVNKLLKVNGQVRAKVSTGSLRVDSRQHRQQLSDLFSGPQILLIDSGIRCCLYIACGLTEPTTAVRAISDPGEDAEWT